MVGFPQIPLLHHYYVYSLKLNKEVTILTERESESTQEHDAPDQLSTSRTKRLKSCPMTHRHTTFKWQDLSCIQRKAEYISKLTHSRLTRLTIDWLGRRAYLHATGSISKSNSMCGIQEVMECEQMLFGETKRCANGEGLYLSVPGWEELQRNKEERVFTQGMREGREREAWSHKRREREEKGKREGREREERGNREGREREKREKRERREREEREKREGREREEREKREGREREEREKRERREREEREKREGREREERGKREGREREERGKRERREREEREKRERREREERGKREGREREERGKSVHSKLIKH
ncbi:uncharacterized protein LOC128635364 isoform X1 [Ictalurus punctatus]|uniref:Uncharacterized protein LOC128635364 isoform X1 n=1 Tax=Ictalurus punctatus TaxID=7998 RepID=A0A9F7RKC0_ICTPU|nr:uncharacterized protein LOC128635364 isoform X1 [Ictalurus punctatus]